MKVESGKMKEQRLCQASESLYSVICSLYSLGRTYRYRPYGICTLCFLGHPQGMPLRCCSLSGGHTGTAPTALFSFGRTRRYRPYGVVLFWVDTPVPPLRRCTLSGTHKGCPYGVVLFRADTPVPPLLYLFSFVRTRRAGEGSFFTESL